MRFTKSVLAATTLCLTVAAGAYAAQAAEPATFVGCLHMQKKAAAALDANKQSPNYFAASEQANSAQSFCSNQLYKQGIDRYTNVLALLGAS
ncbi:MAG TPA: hypothetical protein VHZ78_08040 [Rhizomicrobium sp.]|jgi:hypothetical protein|nr:hypothetical protein [Rhizomicrobium sp.]